MNATDVMRYGHSTVLTTLNEIPTASRTEPGVCGVWSVKDIIAHLASYELVLDEILAGLSGDPAPTPLLDRFHDPSGAFNDAEVAKRAALPMDAVLTEYVSAHDRAMTLLDRVPVDVRSRAGTLPWYGQEYALDDFIVYANYGHKREHCAQIEVFRDRLVSRTK